MNEHAPPKCFGRCLDEAPAPEYEMGEAFGRPGIPPRWTSSTKEGVGTAYSTASRVWFTTSHGILNEIYYPTIDSPQVRDVEFLITDGETFFHEEKRHLTHEIEHLAPDTLGYRITSTSPGGQYRLTKEIITDPHQPCVLINARLEGPEELLSRLQVYVLAAPHLEKGGAGNSCRRFHTAGREIIVAWKDHVHLAIGANVGFVRTSCGFVGASDAWQDLNDNCRMDWTFDRAEGGNVAAVGQIDLSRGYEFTVGLGFGDSRHAAVTTLVQSLAAPFASHRQRFIEQWDRVCCDLVPMEQVSTDDGRLYRISRSMLLAHEDKTFAGAIIASASIPWGQMKGDEDIGGYHLVWTRDLVNSATGLLACGNTSTPQRALVYLACSQWPDGRFPQNFWIDGTPYWSGTQLDEVAFPVMLAWRLWKGGALREFDPYPMVLSAAAFMIREGPMTQQERWEENSGYSPSTLAATIAALVCAADLARSRGDEREAAFLEEYADFVESHVEAWTATTDGTLVPGIPKHYIRINPTDADDPGADEDPNSGMLAIPNRPPGEQRLFQAKEIVDAGFLELVRYGIRRPGDPLIEDSLRVIDAILKVDTPCGPCWRRYNHDGYGERPDGRPYLGWGRGRAWPLLTGERAHYEMSAGRDVKPFITAMERFASKGGLLPEQVWDEPDLPERDMYLGRPTGSAMPLMWAHAEYVKLLRSVADDRVFDLIPIVAARYLNGEARKDLEVWKPARRVRRAAPGQTLRVQAPLEFQLRWTIDDDQTVHETASTPSGLGIGFVDIPIPQDQTAPVRFAFCTPVPFGATGEEHEVRIEQRKNKDLST